MKLSKYINDFVKQYGRYSTTDVIRHHFMIYLVLICTTVSLFIILYSLAVDLPQLSGISTFSFIFIFNLLGVFSYIKKGSLEKSSNIILSGLFIASTIASISFLNAYNSFVFYYLSIPILAYFLAGSKSGALWTSLCTLALLVIAIFSTTIKNSHLGVNISDSAHAFYTERANYLATIMLIGIICYLYTYLYYKDRNILTEQQKKLLHIINHDELTGIYNYKRITEIASEIIDQDVHSNQRFSYTFIHVENFHNINNEYGYEIGDACIQTLTKSLNDQKPINYYIGRTSGTFFALITLNPDSYQKITENVDQILSQAWHNIVIQNKKIDITYKIGTAIYPEDGTLLKEITNKADRRMFDEI